MSVYTMVAVICLASAAVPIAIVWLVSRARTRAAESQIRKQLVPMAERQAQMEERLQVLEKLATDPHHRLEREIAAL